MISDSLTAYLSRIPKTGGVAKTGLDRKLKGVLGFREEEPALQRGEQRGSGDSKPIKISLDSHLMFLHRHLQQHPIKYVNRQNILQPIQLSLTASL